MIQRAPEIPIADTRLLILYDPTAKYKYPCYSNVAAITKSLVLFGTR